MTRTLQVAVVGAGIGGLCSAIMLASRGLAVRVFERTSSVGGKAGTVCVDGVEVDTGPSVLTMVDVFEDVFAAAGSSLRQELKLVRPQPGFRYLYPDGASVDVFHELEETLDSVQSTLGSSARQQLADYLGYAQRIWQAAAPHFVMADAPDVAGLLFGGVRRLGAVMKIDPFRALGAAIDARVREPHLRDLLKRYATYNGSDVRRAPATLGCIAHVELALGGYGVAGGMIELARALERAARRLGVTCEFDTAVEVIEVGDGAVTGVRTSDGRHLACDQVVLNADVGALRSGLLGSEVAELAAGALAEPAEPSMSAHTAIWKVARTEPRVAHTVLFPERYEGEFEDIFDHGRVPQDPTVYLCAQESCNLREGWPGHEPVFAMINAPAVSRARRPSDEAGVRRTMRDRLLAAQLMGEEDRIAWWRTPEGLADQFPGSDGALYGDASNGPMAAFRRPPNRLRQPEGLYLASGSAHPGGGVPMVAQSGKLAAEAILADRGFNDEQQ